MMMYDSFMTNDYELFPHQFRWKVIYVSWSWDRVVRMPMKERRNTQMQDNPNTLPSFKNQLVMNLLTANKQMETQPVKS